ncbi:hypothetical protein [Actinoplanes sp. NPDC051411]|uniref:hypothetical protein n=1 Tax=Actinoplanes sp. NPDC051411 TaxID=3155522 RepID=UPI00341C7C9D
MVTTLKLWEAVLWGGLGGLIASLVNLVHQIVRSGYRWPWARRKNTKGAYAFVTLVSAIVGAVVAGAASAQMTGLWPAFILGATAPSVVRGMLGSGEVVEKKPGGSAQTGGEAGG